MAAPQVKEQDRNVMRKDLARRRRRLEHEMQSKSYQDHLASSAPRRSRAGQDSSVSNLVCSHCSST